MTTAYCKFTSENISVSKDALSKVLHAFDCGELLSRSDIRKAVGLSPMTVNRAVTKLTHAGILLSRRARKEISPDNFSRCGELLFLRDSMSLLILDVSSRRMEASLFDTSLKLIETRTHIYSDSFSYEDNLRLFLNGLYLSGMLERWEKRKSRLPSLCTEIVGSRFDTSPNRKTARRISELTDKMYESVTAKPCLAIITPTKQELYITDIDRLPPIFDSDGDIRDTVSSFLDKSPDLMTSNADTPEAARLLRRSKLNELIRKID